MILTIDGAGIAAVSTLDKEQKLGYQEARYSQDFCHCLGFYLF